MKPAITAPILRNISTLPLVIRNSKLDTRDYFNGHFSALHFFPKMIGNATGPSSVCMP